MPDIARLTTTDDYVVPDEFEQRPTLPREVTIVWLSITGDTSGLIDIRYSWICNYSMGVAENITSVAGLLIDDRTKFTWKRPTVTAGGKSRLSLRSDVFKYIMFYLDEGNYQFAVDDFPFRVIGEKEPYFFESRCVWKEGINVESRKKPILGYPCKVAHFLHFADRDLDENGEGYTSKFNIYLDLIYTDGTKVPITVDPDVGYPGGHS